MRGRDAARHVLPPGRGRGSSVGSIVCYLTGLSHVDPVEARLSLGRFLNQELASVPDIDLDFPRDIRERLIVRVHERYGPRQAALVGAFATYRARGAIRELGKALGLPPSRHRAAGAPRPTAGTRPPWARSCGACRACAERAGDRRFRALDALAREIAGLPRHLSQHPGGMVDLRPAARPPRAAAARGHGRAHDLPVGQGLLRRRRLPQDRPARPGHALGHRVVRDGAEPGHAASTSTSPASAWTTARCTRRSRPPTPSACSRSSRARRCRCSCARARSASTTSWWRSRSCGPGRSRAAPCTPTCSGCRRCATTPRSPCPYDHPLLEEPLRETLGVIVFQDQVLDVAQSRSPASPPGRPRRCGAR